jgi:hypothetical protein
MRHC